MKKFKKIIAGLLMAAMCLFAICGCSNKPANDETTEPKEITICFFNGESKLGEIKVEEGNHDSLVKQNGVYANIYRSQVANIKDLKNL